MEPRNPVDILIQMGDSFESVILIGSPFLLLLLVVIVYAILYQVQAKKVEKDLEPFMDIDLEPDQPDRDYKAIEETPEATDALPEVPSLAADVTATKAEPAEPPPPAKDLGPQDVRDIMATDENAWLKRLRGGLEKTRLALTTNVGGLFGSKKKIDEETLEQLHEALYRADVGVVTTDKLVDHVRTRHGKETESAWEAVRASLQEEALKLLSAPERDQNIPTDTPRVILIVGVNGVGKTTTIGKLTAHFLAEGKSVLLAAADTFRAAAIDQLCVWGDRLGVEVIKHQSGSDPAAVAYDAVKAANSRSVDTLIIDTAGRLHNKQDLMQELGKINRVLSKDLPGAPHETWLVIDATTGQNAVMQVKAFNEVVKLTGLVVTKVDGTAKGGIVVGISDQFGLPVRYIGVGEQSADLRVFKPREYVDSLF